MTKITEDQITKYNSNCKNNFKFDINYYLYHGEKTLFKYIKLENGGLLKAELMYQSYNENVPLLWLSVWIKDGGFLKSHGLGQKIKIGEPQKTKKFSLLQKLTEKCTDEYILSLHDKKATSKREII